MSGNPVPRPGDLLYAEVENSLARQNDNGKTRLAGNDSHAPVFPQPGGPYSRTPRGSTFAGCGMTRSATF